MKSRIPAVLLAASLFCSTPIIRADDAPPTPAFAQVHEGELRLDGRITAVTGPGEWQLSAISWTSPRGVLKEFDEPKNKSLKLAPDGKVLSNTGSEIKLEVVKLGTEVAVIGTNKPDGSVLVRTVFLTTDTGNSKKIGMVYLSHEASILFKKGDAARDANQVTGAAEYYNQGIAAAGGVGDHIGETFGWARLGGLYARLGQDQKALEAYNHGLEISKASGDTNGEAGVENGLGNVYSHMEKAPEAVKYYEAAVAAMGNSVPKAQVLYLSNLVHAYRWNGDSTKATSAAERELQIAEGSGLDEESVEAELTLAQLLPTTEKDRIDGLLKKAQAALPKIGNDHDRGYMTLMVARIDMRLGRTSDALDAMKSAAGMFDAAGDTELAASTRKRAQELQDKENQPAKPAAGAN